MRENNLFMTGANNELIMPTFVLCHASQTPIDTISCVEDFIFNDVENSAHEISFSLRKEIDGKKNDIYDIITDFQLIYIPEWQRYYQIQVATDENEEGNIKHVSGIHLCEAELSQLNLEGTEINTEADIARDDYEVVVLYNPNNPNQSLLHRILKDKAPHYSIKYVSPSLCNLVRSFSITNNINDFLRTELAEEINCIVKYDSYDRSISLYDTLLVCNTCGHRGEHEGGICSNCGSNDIYAEYGTYTGIVISTSNLAETLNIDTDKDAVKTCYRVTGGDEMIDAAIRAVNPNGTNYIYAFNNEMLSDMSDELRNKIIEYNKKYSSLQPTYKDIMTQIFDLYDDILYYETEMPTTSAITSTTATVELNKLTASTLGNIGISSLNRSTAKTTVDNAVLGVCKIFLSDGYYVKIETSSFTYSSATNSQWNGKFTVYHYSDEDDIVTNSSNITLTVTNDYETFVKQKISRVLQSQSTGDIGTDWSIYSLDYLSSFESAYQSCLEVLMELGINDETSNGRICTELYNKYHAELVIIQNEMATRESTINGLNSKLSNLEQQRNNISSQLDFVNFLGDTLYKEFCCYRRDENYNNSNYISDGLNNAELLNKAKELLETANKHLQQASQTKYTISGTIANFLIMKEFADIKNECMLGNWIYIQNADGDLYKLRLNGISGNYSSLDHLDLTFSNACKLNTTSLKSIININNTIQLGQKQSAITGGATSIAHDDLPVNRALLSDANGKVAVSPITDKELGYLNGVAGNVQIQLDDKLRKDETAVSSNRLVVHDIRNEVSSPTLQGDKQLSAFFSNVDMPTSTWYSGLNVAGWTSAAYQVWQLVSGSNTSINDVLKFRTGVGSTWNAWKTIAFTDSNISGNAGTTTKLLKPRVIGLTDADSTNIGTSVSFDGSKDVTLKLPSTIKASLTGNADSATILKTNRNFYVSDFSGSNIGTATSFNGSENAILKLPDTIKTSTFIGELTGNASTASKLHAARTIYLSDADGTNTTNVSFDGSKDITIKLPDNIEASKFVGSLIGNADTAAKLQTPIKINGTDFNGTVDITTANWGTARNISISDADGTNIGSAVSINGSENKTLKLPSTIKATLTGNADSATKLLKGRNIKIDLESTSTPSFDGTEDITLGITGILPIEHGGHGATTASGALKNLGLTATATELNYMKGVTSNVQTQLNGKTKGASKSATTAATAGWYRIAQSNANISNCTGIFQVNGAVAGKHTVCTLIAETSYGITNSTNINVLSCGHYSSAAITKARIVYHTTYSNNYAYLEVYIPTATATGITVHLIGGIGWSLVSPSTAGSIPSGYSNKEVTLSNNTMVAGTFSGNATSASKLTNTSAIGSATNPVYFSSSGVPIACTYSLGKSVPSNALFTDVNVLQGTSTTSSYRALLMSTGYSADGTEIPTSETGQVYKAIGIYAQPSTGSIIANAFIGKLTGTADKATALTTSAGSETQPIYFSDGKPKACTYTLKKSVPSDAIFTDTVYVHPEYTTKSNGLYKITVDKTGHVSSVITVTKSDITDLGIPASDTTYSQATSSVLGLVKIGYTQSGKNYPVKLNSNGQMYVNVPWENTNTTYPEVSASATGLMTPAMLEKLNGITDSADSVSFERSLTSGTKIGTININGTETVLYCQTNTDTHYTSHLYVGSSGGNSNATSVVSNPYLLCVDNTTNRNSVQLKAGSNMSISAVNGVVTFSAIDTVYTLPTASSSVLGGVKTTSTVTNASGYTACPIIEGVPYYKDTKTTYTLSSFGINVTATELNYMKGVTSNIQDQLNNKAKGEHTHNYAASDSSGGSALTAKKLTVPITLTIGNKSESFDGSKNISLTLTDIGASAINHSHNYLSNTPAYIEFSGTTSSSGHGGYLDFHFNGSTADYTSRIIELASGTLSVIGNMVVKDSTAYTTNQLRNMVLVTDDPGEGVAVSYANGSIICVYE